MRLTAGARLGPYEISGPLGAGGMGEVYRARDTRLGRDVAVKVLPQDVTRDAGRLARFEREARSASGLNHPNIVTVHDFTAADGEMWLVMELIRGESLREILARGALPIRRVLPIAAGIADALATAHEAGLVHRDLKPENIMITSDGTPKILDFGLVKTPASEAATTSPTEHQISRAGAILGTATYMSPEQARGETVDFRSDQFSFGLILHEMAAGVHPFRRSTPFETLTAIVQEEAPPLPQEIPEPLAWIVERCLEKETGRRYGSTADLAHDLARLQGRSGSVKPIDANPARPRSLLLGWVVATALLTIVALLGFAIWGRRTPPDTADPIHVDVAVPEAKIYLDEVILPIMISPDGRYLAMYGTSAGGTSDLWLRDLRSGTMRRLAENALGAAWSADGRSIAFFAEGKLKTVPAEGGPPHTVCDARPEGTPSWRGDTILFGRYSGELAGRGIYRVDARGGVPELLLGSELESAKPSLPWWPHFLPDGERFLFVKLMPIPGRPEVDHELMVGSLAGDPPKSVGRMASRAAFADGHLLFVRDGTLVAQPFDPDTATLSGEPKPLTADVHYFRSTGLAAFSVSDNGILAWRSARRPSRLVWLNREGNEVGAVAADLFDPDGRLSADGSRYAVGVFDPKQGISDLWVYDLERGNPERLTFQMLDERSPVWAHDGRSIYYRTDGGGGPPDIMRLDPGVDGGTLVHRGTAVEEPEDVSPDGKRLLFMTRYITTSDIHVLPLDPPGPARPFVATPFNDTSPRFSPDGRWVAYSSDLSGRPEVYIRRFEGADAPRRISKDGGTRPRWRADGTELYFLAPGGLLMATEAEQGAPRVLFAAPTATDFEPAPDGSRFLVQLEQRSAEPPIHLLINWASRLGKE